ncbi:uncharacterized protein MONBRDRAFT_32146 [Monosiga brevicollis MX1]|uniref:C2H2-type domain-containing protein n=1 Tax=Monosiga brevicollis TaxID=81824 RepID=A9UXY4_MONBE|nr:uncharacterized protein MONBRDRAFT_32146 [Monosiga brevicollis MX1]EDQ89767.1 predicted protein [Monosiga brevicollis MX1]|eukprot:XP_001745189.1 hypothetical protein [Monosiga brevicollis MX1]
MAASSSSASSTTSSDHGSPEPAKSNILRRTGSATSRSIASQTTITLLDPLPKHKENAKSQPRRPERASSTASANSTLSAQHVLAKNTPHDVDEGVSSKHDSVDIDDRSDATPHHTKHKAAKSKGLDPERPSPTLSVDDASEDVNKYSCDVCGKSYQRRTHLRRHQKSHQDRYEYSCDICHKQFYRKPPPPRAFTNSGGSDLRVLFALLSWGLTIDQMMVHQWSHRRNQPLQCIHSGCTATFADSIGLARHVETAHRTQLPPGALEAATGAKDSGEPYPEPKRQALSQNVSARVFGPASHNAMAVAGSNVVAMARTQPSQQFRQPALMEPSVRNMGVARASHVMSAMPGPTGPSGNYFMYHGYPYTNSNLPIPGAPSVWPSHALMTQSHNQVISYPVNTMPSAPMMGYAETPTTNQPDAQHGAPY